MKKKGFFLILSAILVFVLFIYITSFSTQKEESNIEKNTVAMLTPPPTVASVEVEDVKEPESTEIPKPEEIGKEKENLSTRIEVADLPEEAWKILDISEERLIGELKIYTNSVGYATADTVHYAGEITINHLKNTITVGFYIQNEDLFQFNLVYDRANKAYSFEQW